MLRSFACTHLNEALAPARAQRLVAEAKPLAELPRRTLLGLDLRAVATLVLCGAWVAGVIALLTVPHLAKVVWAKFLSQKYSNF